MPQPVSQEQRDRMARLEQEAGRVPGVDPATPARAIHRAAIVGAGTMGGGIAMSHANAGIPVTLIDVDQASLERGLGRIRANYAATVAKGKLEQAEMDRRMALIQPATDIAAAAGADIVIEAVFERMDLKLEIFAKLDRVMQPGAILASNTSMLDVDAIAAATSRPQDVVGTHFFSPANVMRLLEVVRGKATAPAILAATLALGWRIGKVPVVVGVCDGFVGNRMLEPYFRESDFLLAEGATPEQVDAALSEFGLAMGPCAMLDMAGVDVRWDVVKRKAQERQPGQRHSELIERLGEAGRFGQKTGAGWYRYDKGDRTPKPDPALLPVLEAESRRQGVARRGVTAREITERCLYGLVNEGADILQEGIALRGGDIDLVYLHGYGFPAWRGGPMQWADEVGLAVIVAAIDRFQKELGSHWQVSPLLRRLASEGGSLANYRNPALDKA